MVRDGPVSTSTIQSAVSGARVSTSYRCGDGRLPERHRFVLMSWVIGGPVVGAVLALSGLLITWTVLRRRRARVAEPDEQIWSDTLWRAKALYRQTPAKHRHYVRFKLPMDPVYRQVCEGVSAVDRIVDLGTGLGSLPALLALRKQGREILAVDWDEEKIETARLACKTLPAVTCIRADVHEYEIPAADVICLVDVLHYYALDRQRRLLSRGARALREGGVLVIRETDRGSRSLLTQWIEGVAVRVGWNKGPGLCYRTRQELVHELESLGLNCAAEGASSRVHRGNILIWAQRPLRAGAVPLKSTAP